MRLNKKVQKLVESVNPRDLRNNTQRVLLSLLREGDWVSRSSLRIPSVTARLRDLRKSEHGSFTVECATARQLNRKGTAHSTFYRLAPECITSERVEFAFRGDR